MQRGRTAKPRSAAIVAKVSPVLAHVPPKQENAKCGQSHPPPQEEWQPRPPRPSDKDETTIDTQQPVPAEPDPVEEFGCPENRDMIEVLRFRASRCLSL